MPSPKPTSVDLPAGLVMNKGSVEAMGRYVRAQWVRFWQGKPQKIKGWARRSTAPMRGIPRAILVWNDLLSRSLTAAGTTMKLYAIDSNSTKPTDITPIVASVALTNAFSTIADSRVVTVTAPSHGAIAGQTFHIDTGPTVGGLNMTGEWIITAPISNNSFSFTHTSPATATVGATGAATFQYEYPPGGDIPTSGLGWGSGTWSESTWGTPRSGSRVLVEPRTWTLDHFGKLLLANPLNGPIFSFDPAVTPFARAERLAPTEAPGAMRSFFVTPERFIIALGASPDTDAVTDSMNIRWCVQGDPSDWTPGLNKTAGARRLTEGKKIVAGTPFSGQTSLIWTDSSLYSHTFTGSTFVFNTNPVASECGLAGPHAYTKARGAVYWLGNRAFHYYSGGVNVIPKSGDVSDWIFENLRDNYEMKTVSFFVPEFNEVWWIMVPNGETEPGMYAAVSLTDFNWITGTLERTASTPLAGANFLPILAAKDGYIYTHETGLDGNGAALEAFIETAVIQIEEGDRNLEVSGFIPDFERLSGSLEMSVRAYDRPNDPGPVDQDETQIDYGDGVAEMRVQGRLLSYMIRSNEIGGDFRFGKHSFLTQGAGRRPTR